MTRQYKPDYMESAIFDVLDELSTETLVYANQQHHELTPPYVTLAVETRVTQGQDERWRILDDGTQVYRGVRTGTITLLVIGDLCGERADEIVNALKRLDASATFKKYGPVLHSAMPIKLGPIVTEGEQVEQAYAIDLQYRAAVLHIERGSWIETIALGYAYGLDPNGSDDTRGAMVISKPGTTPPPDEVLIVVIDPPNGVLRAGTDTDRLPITHVQPFANIDSFATSTSDPTIAEIIRPPYPAKDFLRFHKPGTVDYMVTVYDKAGREVSDRVTLQISS